MSGSINAYVVGFSVLSVYVLNKFLVARSLWKQLGKIPGRHTVFSAFSPLGNIFEMKYVATGGNHNWRRKHEDFRKHGWDIITTISLYPTAGGGFVLADAQAAKTVFSSRSKFPKYPEGYELLKVFGSNLVVSDFAEWKRHRKIVAPAFSEKNNKRAFEEAVRAITSLYEGRWHAKQEVIVDETVRLTMEAVLITFSAAAFGHQIKWEDDEAPPGHQLSFKQSVQAVGDGILFRLMLPKWLFEWAPTKAIREVRDGFAEFGSYLVETMKERRLSGEKDEKRDLLSGLIAANGEFSDDGEQRLDDEELIGNMFIFYLAGHETSGHTLCFALNMLAVHQEEQEALYQHIQSILPDGRPPTYEDLPRLNRVTATLYETLRMFPLAPVIARRCAEDTTFMAGNKAGETRPFSAPAGSRIIIDVPGLHYNPRYWEDPFTFRPERFMGEWNRDAFVPFSGGARACIGRAFFETTGLAILTMLIQHYRVEPHPKFAGESFEQLKERYTQNILMVTLTPTCSSLVFKRRK